MFTDTLHVAAILVTALAMAGAFAHLYAMPNKLAMDADAYFAAQQMYRGWARPGIVVAGSLLLSVAVAIALRGSGAPFVLSLAAAVLIAADLGLFFAFVEPANRATANWMEVPASWQSLRSQWECGHAAGAVLYLLALSSLTVALAARARG